MRHLRLRQTVPHARSLRHHALEGDRAIENLTPKHRTEKGNTMPPHLMKNREDYNKHIQVADRQGFTKASTTALSVQYMPRPMPYNKKNFLHVNDTRTHGRIQGNATLH